MIYIANATFEFQDQKPEPETPKDEEPIDEPDGRELFQTCVLRQSGQEGSPVPVGGSGFIKVVHNSNIPEHDYFVPDRVYPLLLRHNNLSFQDDAMLDGRVTCLRFGDLDLILHTGVVAQFHNAISFQDFVETFTKGGEALDEWLQKDPAK